MHIQPSHITLSPDSTVNVYHHVYGQSTRPQIVEVAKVRSNCPLSAVPFCASKALFSPLDKKEKTKKQQQKRFSQSFHIQLLITLLHRLSLLELLRRAFTVETSSSSVSSCGISSLTGELP